MCVCLRIRRRSAVHPQSIQMERKNNKRGKEAVSSLFCYRMDMGMKIDQNVFQNFNIFLKPEVHAKIKNLFMEVQRLRNNWKHNFVPLIVMKMHLSIVMHYQSLPRLAICKLYCKKIFIFLLHVICSYVVRTILIVRVIDYQV